MNLDSFLVEELISRYYYLFEKYVNLSIDLAKKLEDFGRMRNELQYLVVELNKRKVEIKDSEELKKKIESFVVEFSGSDKTENK